MRQTNDGFTLVELSIVLVILGLLVGGVLAGQSLIRSAEMRSIVTERDKLITAQNAFHDKYFALPGDMANAYRFWSGAGLAGCATDDTDPSYGCNGDGDGAIRRMERVKVGMHLGQAGLIEGNYTGDGAADQSKETAINSRFPTASWIMHSSEDEGVNISASRGRGLYVSLVTTNTGMMAGVPGSELNVAGLSLEEAWNVDAKTDDGHASTGRTRGKDEQCYDIATDLYGMAANGPSTTGLCTLTFIIKPGNDRTTVGESNATGEVW